jgi:acyl-CoA synthetase (AMP-forming)/AMP-acid ligase II
VIIRGGENISALEVEDPLPGIAGVAEVAVVAAPGRATRSASCGETSPHAADQSRRRYR